MSKIVNGINAAAGRYPYMAALLTSPNATYDYDDYYYQRHRQLQNYDYYDYEDTRVNKRQICGATLITPNVVLTAAHCVLQLEDPGELDVAFGCESITDENDCTIIPSEFVVRNPDFLEDFTRAGDDLALIFLAEEVDFPVVRLAGAGIVPSNGQPVRNIGWGETLRTDPAPAERLQQIDVEMVENDVCIPQMKEAFDIFREYYDSNGGSLVDNGNLDTVICAIGDAKSVCFGDSGGPLFYACDSGEESDIQIGVASFVTTCAGEGQPVAFEQINSQAGITFITEQLALRGQSIQFVETLDNFCPSTPLLVNPAPTPFPTFNAEDWTCETFRFGDLSVCDCNCGVPDVDCAFFNTPEVTNGCGANEICVNDECVEFVSEEPTANPTTEVTIVTGSPTTEVPTDTDSPTVDNIVTSAPTVGKGSSDENPLLKGELEMFVIIGLLGIIAFLLMVICCFCCHRNRQKNILETSGGNDYHLEAKDIIT